MARVNEKLGSQFLPRILDDIELENAAQYDPFKNETQNEQIFLQIEENLSQCQKCQISTYKKIYCYLEGTRWQEAIIYWDGVMMPIECFG